MKFVPFEQVWWCSLDAGSRRMLENRPWKRLVFEPLCRLYCTAWSFEIGDKSRAYARLFWFFCVFYSTFRMGGGAQWWRLHRSCWRSLLTSHCVQGIRVACHDCARGNALLLIQVIIVGVQSLNTVKAHFSNTGFKAMFTHVCGSWRHSALWAALWKVPNEAQGWWDCIALLSTIVSTWYSPWHTPYYGFWVQEPAHTRGSEGC